MLQCLLRFLIASGLVEDIRQEPVGFDIIRLRSLILAEESDGPIRIAGCVTDERLNQQNVWSHSGLGRPVGLLVALRERYLVFGLHVGTKMS